MLKLSAPGVRIAGTAVALPSVLDEAPPGRTGPVDNHTLLATRYSLEKESGREAAGHLLRDLEERVGLHRRHHAHAPGTPFLDGEADSSTLCAAAARLALERAGLALADIRLAIVATSTPPRWTATTSGLAGAQLGYHGAFLDVRMGCAGGLMALTQGALLCRASSSPVLVMAADTFSKAAPPREVLAALALGDAGAACVLVPDERAAGFAAIAVDGAPQLGHLMTAPGRLPPTEEQLRAGQYALQGDPEAMAEASLAAYRDVVTAVLCGDRPDVVLLHQTQRPLMRRVIEACGLDGVTAPEWLGDYANTGTANVLVGLDRLARSSQWQTGTRVLMAAVGGGLTAAAAIYRVEA